MCVLGLCALLCASPVLGGEIHRAIEADDVARVKQILESNPEAAFERDDDQFSQLPIHTVAGTGNVEIAKLLLEAGADNDAGDSDNSTALGVAAMYKHAELVAFLITEGADVNRRDRKADCPLSFAVYGRDEAVVQQLLDAGADLYFRSPNGETLLHIACMRGVRNLVEHLLENNSAELEIQTRGGGTALGLAAMRGHQEIVELLIKHNANTNPAKPGENNPIHFTTWGNHIECAKVLLENGADINHPGHRNTTALTYAAENSSAEMVGVLIQHGALVNHVNDNGVTPLIMASAKGHMDRVQALLKGGADPNIGTDEDGRSALQLAALGGYTEVAKLLLEDGAEIDATTPSGETPLRLAQYYGHHDLAQLLTIEGARGSAVTSVDRSLVSLGNVGKKEAAIWFLGHSGWAVKTKDHLLIFDYFPQGEDPARPALCNGHINPGEIANERVAVFASHFHGDHYSPAIFEWREHVSDITYFLGLQPQDTPPYEFMPERLEKTYGNLKLTTIHSTDAGVGMVIEVDGLTIFHAGDHANGRIGLMDEFTDEIDFLEMKGIRPDICFMGILGCSLGTPEQVKEGIQYTLRTLKPRVFIPMHAGTRGHLYHEFIEGIEGEFESVQMVAAENRGDHFYYSKGTVIDPKRDGSLRAAAE
jgi:ankyrin repeat protein/L-ascorbate metabolism protein UlaG (beta-lactamase superfamily)